MAGRTRKPTELKRLQGTLQPCRENPLEPVPQKGWPVASKDLSQDITEVYNQLCQLMDGMNILALSDAFAVEVTSGLIVHIRDLRRAIQDEGYTYENQGLTKPNPKIGMLRSAEANFMGMCSRLGLSPADRSKVSEIKMPLESNPFASLDG